MRDLEKVEQLINKCRQDNTNEKVMNEKVNELLASLKSRQKDKPPLGKYTDNKMYLDPLHMRNNITTKYLELIITHIISLCENVDMR